MPDSNSVAVRPALLSDLPLVAKIHQMAFPGFLMTLLGPSFLQAYYQTVFDYSESLFLVAEDDEGKPFGFVAGFAQPEKFYALLGSRKKRMMISAALYLSIRPKLWKRVLENMKLVSRRSTEGSQDGLLRVELASIGISPAQGRRGYGKALVNAFLGRARERAADIVELSTDANGNDAVNGFYRGLGFTLSMSEERAGGRLMNHYAYSFRHLKD
ncbi:GNAT family N-acetyltransferase [Pseudomonas sp. JM0905a]|uniref:GNAT family N-acetyltransferase n=1 Tax=Pseudomonas sp. JM0905a TaxID=2772484 RepID=UPI001686A8C3|nr:GNAT family N-acetyltransferase [Pseudomonas sp. JM0905a]MBD2837683.1 GNAT family N-acetyltransferase [Pseudomonas sp. JM0905a]